MGREKRSGFLFLIFFSPFRFLFTIIGFFLALSFIAGQYKQKTEIHALFIFWNRWVGLGWEKGMQPLIVCSLHTFLFPYLSSSSLFLYLGEGGLTRIAAAVGAFEPCVSVSLCAGGE